jgi:hypothetical protein
MARNLASKKVYAERIHAKRRALERAGVNYNRFDLRRMAEQIQQGYSIELSRQSNTRHIHILAYREYNGAPTRVHVVVYNRKTKQIVTFLDGLV